MKTISRIAIGAAVVLLLAATLQPAFAACATPRLLNNGGAFLVSNPDWGGAGATRTCQFGFGCYLSESEAPISAGFAGVFWGFDTTTGTSSSDPAIGFGIDNGGWGVDQWTKSRVADFGQPYYYPAFISLDVPGEPNGTSGNAPNWSFPVDGCPNDIDPDSCSCFLVSDQWAGVGYVMADSAITDGIGNFIFDGFPADAGGGASMVLAPTPVPEVTLSDRDAVSGDVTMTIAIGALGADFRDAGCSCNLGFMVYQQVLGRGGLAPMDRSIATGWVASPDATGGPQAMTPLGQTASIKVDCDPALQQDIYLATAIVESGGLGTTNVSANSFRIECGANLADPNREDRGPGRSSDAPRGRDNNRGRGQRDR